MSSNVNPLGAAREAVSAVKDAVLSGAAQVGEKVTGKHIPGAPGVEPPALVEPTEPRGPMRPKADQQAPATVSPTGAPIGSPAKVNAQTGAYLTTAQGVCGAATPTTR